MQSIVYNCTVAEGKYIYSILYIYSKFFLVRVAQYGAALLSMVRRCSVWCGVAQHGAALLSYGAALLSMVRHCSVMVRRCSVGSPSACCKAGPSSILGSAPQGRLFPLSLQSDEEMEKGPGERRRISGLYEWD